MRLVYFFLSIVLFAQTGLAAEISGRVVNASQDSSGVTGATVLLQRVTASTPTPLAKTETDHRGEFRLVVNDLTPPFLFYLAVDFSGVRYVSDEFSLTDSRNVNITLTVHDTTHSTEGVDAFMHHIFIDHHGRSLLIRESHILNNPGTKTIINSMTDNNLGPALFKFRLPPGAFNFQPLSAPSSHELTRNGDTVLDRGVLIPGKKTISFAYEIPMMHKQLHISAHVPHSARTFDLFLGSKNLAVTSSQLEDYGPFIISGEEYHRYGASNVDADSEIPFTIKKRGIQTPQQTPTLALTVTATLLLIGLILSAGGKQGEKTAKKTARKNISQRHKR